MILLHVQRTTRRESRDLKRTVVHTHVQGSPRLWYADPTINGGLFQAVQLWDKHSEFMRARARACLRTPTLPNHPATLGSA
jgi:hypothetical protein